MSHTPGSAITVRATSGCRSPRFDPSGESGSDATLLAQGFATVTALSPVWEATDADVGGLVDEIRDVSPELR